MKILFIQTGGTIDKDYPRKTEGYAFEISNPAVTRIFDHANVNFEFEIFPLLQKDSLDLTDEDRQLIFKTCQECSYQHIIITHGTDTMIDTGRQLFRIKGKKIILTGALRPERFANSDADFNLGAAVGALQAVNQGVYICMNGLVIPVSNARRDKKTGQFYSVK